MSDFEQTRAFVRRRIGLDDIHAVLGNASGQVYVDPINKPGVMYVRYTTAAGLSLPPMLPMGPNFVGDDTPGSPVICRYDNNNQLVIWGNDNVARRTSGMSPVANNPAATVNQQTTATETVIPFSSSPTSPASAFIVVRSLLWRNAGTPTLFAASDDDGSGGMKGKKDLTSFFPTAGNHRLITYFLKTDNTLEIVGSTTQPMTEPLDFTDILELFSAASANALPGQAWRLSDGQTTLIQDNYWMDLREIINASGGASPLTTKGDLFGHSTVDARVPVGTDGYGLVGDSFATLGVSYSPIQPIFKLLARAVATSNINTSSPGATIDGVSLSSGDRVLLTAQSAPSNNGLWIWNGAASALTRPTDYAAGSGFQAFTNIVVFVLEGTAKAGTYWRITTANPIFIGSTDTSWSQIVASVASGAVTGKAPLANGGTNADLSATGPGVLIQNANGANISVLGGSPLCGGRLTLTSGLPVTIADVTAATIVYFTPFLSKHIALYDGSTGWKLYTFSELSVAVPSTVFRIFDIFIYDNAGTPTLETLDWNQSSAAITNATNATPIVITSVGHGLSNGDLVGINGIVGNTAPNGKVWTVANVTANTFELVSSVGNGGYTSGGTWYKIPNTRATALALQDGVYVKSGATTRRYLGTGMTTNTSGQTEDSVLRRYLWNLYNQDTRELYKADSTSHSYNAATERFWNTDATIRLQVVQGLARVVTGAITGTVRTATAGNNAYAGIATDSTTLDIVYGYGLNYNTQYIVASSVGFKRLAEGYHYLQAMEAGGIGVNGDFTQVQLKGAVQG